MKLLKFFKWMGLITGLALVYIHLQMQIINLAYQGKEKENQVRKFTEMKGSLSRSILTCKSANHLGLKLLAKDSDMHFIDPSSIIEISASDEFLKKNRMGDHIASTRKANPILSLLSTVSQAEARPQE